MAQNGELKRDSRWFISTKYGLKYIIECHRAVIIKVMIYGGDSQYKSK